MNDAAIPGSAAGTAAGSGNTGMAHPTSGGRPTYLGLSARVPEPRGSAHPKATAACRATQQPKRALPDHSHVDHTLSDSSQLLQAARLEIDTLCKRVSLLQEEIVVLQEVAEKAQMLAHRDELTGLPNRRLLIDRFHQAVAQSDRQHKQIALVFLDLDGFKHINDRFGHAAGDSLLQQVAARLVACIRLCDTACRYGGDEFVILLPEIDGKQAATTVAGKIRDHLALPYLVAGSLITVTTSIGLAVYPVDAKEYVDLMRESDRRMYRNKCGNRATSNAIEPHRLQAKSLCAR